jgi:RNA polymerase sigma-70 factor (ECF subfamily)
MNVQERHDLFSELIARHQSELYAYIFAVVRNWENADDLFQSVCLILWQKFDSFRPGSSFFSWARQTAKFEIRKFLAHKHVPNYISDKLLDVLAETPLSAHHSGVEISLAALHRCREKLSVVEEELLELRYAEGLGSREIADRLQRPQPSVCRSLNRIRNGLLKCIEIELAQQEHSGGSYE